MLRIFLAALAALTPTVSAYATTPCHVQQRVVVKQQHHAQQVVQQYAAPVVAHEVVNYGHSGYAYVQPVVLRTVVNEYPFTYRVGEYIAQEALANRVAEQTLRIVEQRLADALKKQTAPAPSETAVHPGLAVLQNRCANCHKAGAAQVAEKSAPVFFGTNSEWLAPPATQAKALEAINEGRMPPPPSDTLTRNEYTYVAAYFDELNATAPSTSNERIQRQSTPPAYRVGGVK